MGRPKGIVKTGGRKKGVPNKVTALLDEKLLDLKFDPVVELVNCLSQLRPEQKVNGILKLLDFLYPKRKATEISLDSNNNTFADLIIDLHNSCDESIN